MHLSQIRVGRADRAIARPIAPPAIMLPPDELARGYDGRDVAIGPRGELAAPPLDCATVLASEAVSC